MYALYISPIFPTDLFLSVRYISYLYFLLIVFITLYLEVRTVLGVIFNNMLSFGHAYI